MMPLLEAPGGALATASARLLLAAAIARRAAEALADENSYSGESARFILAADRLGRALASPQVSHRRLLLASPAVLERSGRNRTLVEMIDAEPEDDQARIRLAKLLLRALIWRPETFPDPAR